MRKYITIVILILLWSGCNRYIDSDQLTQGLPNQPPIPIGLKLAHTPNSLILSWEISDTAVISHFRIYVSDSSAGTYRLRDSTSSASFSKEIIGLSTPQTSYFKVSAVVKGGLEGPQSAAVFSRVGTMSILINNDDKFTKDVNVTLSLVVPVQASLMEVSEDIEFSGSNWQNFAPTVSRTLSSGDGVKRVHARFQFADGSETAVPISDSIILDTRAFIDSTYFTPNSGIFTAGQKLTFYVVAGEAGGAASVSFAGMPNLALYDDGTNGDLVAGDSIYTRLFEIPISLEVADGVVSGRFNDAAGNIADSRPAAVLLNIASPPLAVSLMASGQSSSSIQLSWSQNSDNDFSFYSIYRDSVGTVSNSSQLLSIINSRTTTVFNDSNLRDNSNYFYRVYVHDSRGLFTASNVASATTEVNLPPTPVLLALRVQDSASFLTWTENTDADFQSYLVYRDTIASFTEATGRLLSIINSQALTSFTDIRQDTLKYYYKVYVADKQGLTSPSNEVATR